MNSPSAFTTWPHRDRLAARTGASILPARSKAHPEVGKVEGTSSWAWLALLALLAATAGAYLWNLAASGYGNSFYAAAVEAGSKSWKAMFFGSLDASNFITVDKPPAALWVMDLSARIFGFNTWSVMVPNIVEGVAAVALLYATVRRVAGHGAGLVAGLLLAVTPVAALIFRFDNPDALLVLLMVAAAYCLTRAIERAGTRWLMAAGALIGFAFLAKMLQAFTVIPCFGLAYLVAAPTRLRRRLLQLVAAAGVLFVSAGWWVTIAALTPAADRPFIDGSPDNSILNLIFVYNGLGRLTGNGGGGGTFSGAAGIFRLFNDEMGGQASWLLPAALVGLVAVLVARRGKGRTDRVRAAAVIWGGWLIITGLVFSYGRGIIHTYYTVALAPAIAALVALGGQQMWVHREHLWARAMAAGAVALTAGWAWALLDRTPAWHPWLRWTVVIAGAIAVAVLLVRPVLRRGGPPAATLAALAVAVTLLAGPVGYTANTLASEHSGTIPVAGPATAGALGGVLATRGTSPGRGGSPAFDGLRSGVGVPGRRTAIPEGGGFAGLGEGVPTGSGTALRNVGRFDGLEDGGRAVSVPGAPSGAGGLFGGGGPGGGSVTANSALVRALEKKSSSYRWVAAVSGSESAASLELATGGEPVMAIGGFNGQGGNLTLAAFEAYVAKGDIHYYLAAGSSGGPGGGSTSSITSWVAAHFRSETIGGQTVYDLTARK